MMSPAKKFALLSRAGRAAVARLVREHHVAPKAAIDVIFSVMEGSRV